MLHVDVFSDIACPWCLIGKRRLDGAIARLGQPVTVRYRAYQLAPDVPLEGAPAAPWYEARFGSRERMRGLFARVEEVGRAEGLAFDFEAHATVANTRLAHRVIQLAEQAEAGAGAVAAEALFRGHFLERVNISLANVVREVLARHAPGLAPTLVDRAAAGEGEAEVERDIRLARTLGVTGVPFFVAGGRVATSGAQPPEELLAMLREGLTAPHQPLERALAG